MYDTIAHCPLNSLNTGLEACTKAGVANNAAPIPTLTAYLTSGCSKARPTSYVLRLSLTYHEPSCRVFWWPCFWPSERR